MRCLCNILSLFILLPVIAGCSYFDTSGAPAHTENGVESVDLMASGYNYEPRDIREVVYEATEGSVEIFGLDTGRAPIQSAANVEPEKPLISTLESNGLVAEEVEAPKTALPGGYMLPSGAHETVVPRSMDSSVDVFSFDESHGTLQSEDYMATPR